MKTLVEAINGMDELLEFIRMTDFAMTGFFEHVKKLVPEDRDLYAVNSALWLVEKSARAVRDTLDETLAEARKDRDEAIKAATDSLAAALADSRSAGNSPAGSAA